ncbi:hypothetical protein D3C77_774420 [compost metagenome]
MGVLAHALTDAAEVEAQGGVAGIARGALQGGDHLVVQAAGMQRMGMADQRQAAGIVAAQIQGFERAAGALEQQGNFGQ